MGKNIRIKDPVVFFDFDNTITTVDVLDDMLSRFSRNDNWMALEEDWKNGRIGSRECLKGQIEGIGITKKALDEYLTGIKLDPYFKKLLVFLKTKNIKTFIVSDNFDCILKKILADNGISGLEVYSNSLTITGDRLTTSFPLTSADCGGCAHCKKTTLRKHIDAGSTAVYVGDGQSDVCGSEGADIVFAKGYLKDHYKNKGLSCISFDVLKDVYDYFQENIS